MTTHGFLDYCTRTPGLDSSKKADVKTNSGRSKARPSQGQDLFNEWTLRPIGPGRRPSRTGVESFLSATEAALTLTWSFSLCRWKSEAVGLCRDCCWLHLDPLHYCINIPALVRSLAFRGRTDENKLIKLCPFLSVARRQSPLRRLLPRRRNPWPWPTTVTWTCKQTRIPQRQDEDTNCLQILVWWPFYHFYSKDRKRKKEPHVVPEEVDGSRETFLRH